MSTLRFLTSLLLVALHVCGHTLGTWSANLDSQAKIRMNDVSSQPSLIRRQAKANPTPATRLHDAELAEVGQAFMTEELRAARAQAKLDCLDGRVPATQTSLEETADNNQDDCKARCEANPACGAFDYTTEMETSACRTYAANVVHSEDPGPEQRRFCTVVIPDAVGVNLGNDTTDATGLLLDTMTPGILLEQQQATPTDCTTSDTVAVTSACKCDGDSTSNECAADKFCWTDNTCNAAAKTTVGTTACTTSDTVAVTSACKCATDSTSNECAVDKFCWTDNTCKAAAKAATPAPTPAATPAPTPAPTTTTDCTPSDTVAITSACKCAADSTSNECAVDKFCWTNNKCKAAAKATTTDCTKSDTVAVTSACKCATGSTRNECAVDKFCWTNNKCKDAAKVTLTACTKSDTVAVTSACKCATNSKSNECAADKFCWTNNRCKDAAKAGSSPTCPKDTSGTCARFSCHASRNAVCENEKCMCGDGLCAVGGACVAPTNTCSCPNGSPATGSACTSDGALICESCDAGYGKSGSGKCQAFTCDLDSSTCKTCKPQAERTASNQCAQCHDGNHLTSDGTCLVNDCTCSNGNAAGTSGSICTTHNTEQCASCDAAGGYSLTSSKTCELQLSSSSEQDSTTYTKFRNTCVNVNNVPPTMTSKVATTWDDCEQLCTSEEACRGFVFNAQNSGCKVLNGVGGAEKPVKGKTGFDANIECGIKNPAVTASAEYTDAVDGSFESFRITNPDSGIDPVYLGIDSGEPFWITDPSSVDAESLLWKFMSSPQVSYDPNALLIVHKDSDEFLRASGTEGLTLGSNTDTSRSEKQNLWIVVYHSGSSTDDFQWKLVNLNDNRALAKKTAENENIPKLTESMADAPTIVELQLPPFVSGASISGASVSSASVSNSAASSSSNDVSNRASDTKKDAKKADSAGKETRDLAKEKTKMIGVAGAGLLILMGCAGVFVLTGKKPDDPKSMDLPDEGFGDPTDEAQTDPAMVDANMASSAAAAGAPENGADDWMEQRPPAAFDQPADEGPTGPIAG